MFTWIRAMLRPENMIALAGSLKRRLSGRDFLKMKADLRGPLPAVLQLEKGAKITGYSDDIADKCINLLNGVGSLGFWGRASIKDRILSTVDDPAKDIFVLFSNNSVVGFTVLHKGLLNDGASEIGYVAVSPKSRGKGHGYLLLTHILSEMKRRGISCACLRTDSFRIPAIRTYLKCGFYPSIDGEDEKRRWQRVMSNIGSGCKNETDRKNKNTDKPE